MSLTAPADLAAALVQVAGTGLLAIGLVLFSASLYYFWSRGRGTLAPWDPPRRFVIDGPYRFVRNPMISGVIFVLLGEAAGLRSRPHAVWAGLVILINVLHPGCRGTDARRTVWRAMPHYKRGSGILPRLNLSPDALCVEQKFARDALPCRHTNLTFHRRDAYVMRPFVISRDRTTPLFHVSISASI